MAEINKEIGLDDVLQGMGIGMDRTDSGGETSVSDDNEKKGGYEHVTPATEIERAG